MYANVVNNLSGYAISVAIDLNILFYRTWFIVSIFHLISMEIILLIHKFWVICAAFY